MVRRFLIKISFSYLFLVLFTMNYSDLTLSVPLGEHPLSIGWSALGIPAEEMGVEGWKKIEDTYYHLPKLEELAEYYRRRLRLTESVPSLKGEEEDFSFISIDGTIPLEETKIVLTFQSMKNEDGSCGGETHCGLIGYVKPLSDLKSYARRLKRSLNWEEDSNPIIFTVSGKWSGRLNEVQATSLVQETFAKVKAVEVFSEPAGEYGRWSGFSGYIKEHVSRNGKKVNIEFAYKYDEFDEVTYIILGTPIVPSTF